MFFYNHRLAEKLLEKETLSLPDIVDILGPRPFAHKKNLLDYLEELRGRLNEEETSTPDHSEEKVNATEFDDEAIESASENEEDDELDTKKKDDDKNSKDDKTKKEE